MRWEYGSDFSFCETFFSKKNTQNEHKDNGYKENGVKETRLKESFTPQQGLSWNDVHKTACGRQAFRALEEHLFAQQAKRHLWLPSYYCQEVLSAFSTQWQKTLYECLPGQPFPTLPTEQLQPGDVLFVCNTFGCWEQPEITLPENSLLVEDHTHAPSSRWARHSKADYCFASMRKNAPIPDGAILWSPKGHPLPQHPSTSNEQIGEMRLRAMKLKSQYLEHTYDDKEHFRTLFLQSEDALAEEKGIVGMSSYSEKLLRSFQWQEWRESKIHNLKMFRELLKDWHEGVLLDGETEELFSLVLVFDDQERRDALRNHLIQKSIYPAILWAISSEQSSEQAHSLSNRMLSLPVDGRYHKDDIQKVCQIIQECRCSNVGSPVPFVQDNMKGVI